MFPQQTGYECGPYALKHALGALGVFVSERHIARIAGTDQRGTDEVRLASAASRFGADLVVERMSEPGHARRALMASLAAQRPVLLCVDNWEHWVTAVGADARHVVLFDSSGRPVIQVVPWATLLERLVFHDGEPVYDLCPVVREGGGPWAHFTPARARTLAVRSRRELLRGWSEVAGPLVSLSEAHAGSNGDAVPLAGLLEIEHEALVTATDGSPGRRWASAHRLADMRFVSRTYGLRVAARKRHAVIGEVTQLLSAQVR